MTAIKLNRRLVMRQVFVLAALLIVAAYAVTASGREEASDNGVGEKEPAKQAASLKGRFVFDGEPPVAQPLALPVGVGGGAFDESLVVNEKNHGIANIVVTLYLGRGQTSPEFISNGKADAADEPSPKIVLQGNRLRPHVVAVQTSQKLRLINLMRSNDQIKIDTVKTPALNVKLPPNDPYDATFNAPERLPVSLSSSVKPWIIGRLVVTDHPFVSISDVDGNFRIDGLPPGSWTFQFWHETSGYVDEGELNGVDQFFFKGRFTLEIPAGETELGDIKIPPNVFDR